MVYFQLLFLNQGVILYYKDGRINAQQCSKGKVIVVYLLHFCLLSYIRLLLTLGYDEHTTHTSERRWRTQSTHKRTSMTSTEHTQANVDDEHTAHTSERRWRDWPETITHNNSPNQWSKYQHFYIFFSFKFC